MPKTLLTAIAYTIKEIRSSQQLSQERLGSVAGIDRTYISGVERGVRNISIHSLENIVEALGVPMTEFVSLVLINLKDEN